MPQPPEPPEFLSEYAVEEWRRLSLELTRLGVLSRLDLGLFAAYCDAYATWRQALEALGRMADLDPVMHGLLVKGDGGTAVQNPLIRIARHAADTMVRIAAEFGMTPAARARIGAGVGPSPEPRKFAGLLAGVDDDDRA